MEAAAHVLRLRATGPRLWRAGVRSRRTERRRVMREFLKKLNRHLHPNWHLHLVLFAGFLWLVWSYT
jgi:hypothetical protein